MGLKPSKSEKKLDYDKVVCQIADEYSETLMAAGVTSISLAMAAASHMLVNAYKHALSVATADQLKESSLDPTKYAVAAEEEEEEE